MLEILAGPRIGRQHFEDAAGRYRLSARRAFNTGKGQSSPVASRVLSGCIVAPPSASAIIHSDLGKTPVGSTRLLLVSGPIGNPPSRRACVDWDGPLSMIATPSEKLRTAAGDARMNTVLPPGRAASGPRPEDDRNERGGGKSSPGTLIDDGVATSGSAGAPVPAAGMIGWRLAGAAATSVVYVPAPAARNTGFSRTGADPAALNPIDATAPSNRNTAENTGGGQIGNSPLDFGASPAPSADAGTGLVINLMFDTQATAAPQSFRNSIQAAANLLQAAITDSITLNIKVGYGEIDGRRLTNGSAEGGSSDGLNQTYSSLRTLLATHETSAADVASVNALPNTMTLNGQNSFFLPSAEAKALGAMSANDPGQDGTVGFAADIPSNLLVGAALHEITHAMGRIADDAAMSLFRYSSPGNHVFTDQFGISSFFSIDGGNSRLADFGTSSDVADFLNPPDSTLTRMILSMNFTTTRLCSL